MITIPPAAKFPALVDRAIDVARRAKWFLAGALLIAIGAAAAPPASALPSFARQTGQECAACHNGFPELTPYGRLFKLNGFVFGGGQSDIPPLASMQTFSFTHTQEPQYGGAAPHYNANNNFAYDGGSLFYGGAIYSDIGLGAFVQATYDHIGQVISWDNTDIRWAHTGQLADRELVFGVSANNNPTVTDVWNSTPAWGFPFVSSGLAPGPAASTLIEGGLAQQVAGLNAYGYWNRLIYAEVGGYHTLSFHGDQMLGVSPAGTPSSDGVIPYWRLAVEPKWGRNSLEVGAFGMMANLVPGRVPGFGDDKYRDVGIDSQYQFLSDLHSASFQASYVDEQQTLNSTFAQGGSSNVNNDLRSFRGKATYYYDQTYGATIGYFRINGSSDATIYGGSALGSPNSAGWTGELDYLPFNRGGPSFWPWLNVKLGVQYVYYTEFDGGKTNYDGNGHNANDNNTLYVFAWFAF